MTSEEEEESGNRGPIMDRVQGPRFLRVIIQPWNGCEPKEPCECVG